MGEVPVAGRTALITGANTGIGAVTARALAARGAHCVLACRSLERTRPVLDAIEAAGGSAEFLPLDLGDLASVRACADAFLALDRPLHLLIDNAGLAGARGLTASGFERAFGTNHVGHFLLTQCLLPRLRESAPARVVVVASEAHRQAEPVDEARVREPTRTLTGLREYGVSKLANVQFSAELARRLDGTGVTTYALHPGVVASDVWRQVPGPFRWLMKRRMLSPEEGAATTLHCALSEEAGRETGLYYDRSAPRPPSAHGQDAALAAALWRASERWVEPARAAA